MVPSKNTYFFLRKHAHIFIFRPIVFEKYRFSGYMAAQEMWIYVTNFYFHFVTVHLRVHILSFNTF